MVHANKLISGACLSESEFLCNVFDLNLCKDEMSQTCDLLVATVSTFDWLSQYI